MSHRQAVDEYGNRRDKYVDNTVAAQDAPFSSGQSMSGVKTHSVEGGTMVPEEQAPERFERKEEVYDRFEPPDSSGNLKKTKYWVCCHRTRGNTKEYRLKDKEPENWDEVQCNGQHEGYWVAEGNLREW